MHVLVGGVVCTDCNCGSEEKEPMVHCEAKKDKWNLGNGNEDGTVPPCHRYRFFVFIVGEVVSLVCLESLVVDNCMCLKCVVESTQWFVHDESVKCPLEERGKDDSQKEAGDDPKKGVHVCLYAVVGDRADSFVIISSFQLGLIPVMITAHIYICI